MPMAESIADVDPGRVFAPRDGYNLVATIFEKWSWTAFWRAYELPLVERWIRARRVSVACDIGCGIGAYTSLLALQSSLCIGVDISESMLAQARMRTRDSRNVSLVQGSLLRLPLKSSSLDAIICSRTMAHISDLRAAFLELGRTAKSCAQLLITDVHPSHPYNVTRVSKSGKSIFIETRKHSIPELLTALQDIGFSKVELQEVRFSDLAPPPDPSVFSKLYKADDPMIFYVIAASRI